MKTKLLFIVIVFSAYLIGCKKNDIPKLTTLTVSDSTFTSVVCGGDISSDGGSDIIAKGVCWSNNDNPTINDNKTIDGSGKSKFESYVNNLKLETKYYIRAYAINSVGIGYGNILSFETMKTTVTDIDGNVYKVIKIGRQVWMAENLKTTKYNDGTSINLTSSGSEWLSQMNGAYCWAQDDFYYKNTYGAYYNWYAVNSGKLAPNGWHIPTETEWKTLQSYLGGESIAGGKLKESGTLHWYYPNLGATNESGFNALPAGYRSKSNGSHPAMGEGAIFWSSTGSFDSYGRVAMNYFSSILDYSTESGIFGFNVRCIKN
ncbi:conserved hypothetical protein [uncultured Paludibacter sp.]|nr:conserved hypothetical protein [uncultured Paludibacter sp.]